MPSREVAGSGQARGDGIADGRYTPAMTTEPTLLGSRFDAAFAWASQLHREQRRKGTPVPYLAHLLGVASLALEMGADEDGAIAALLHDAVEDQGVTVADVEGRFGPAVARIVADCTDADTVPKPPWRARKQAYLDALPAKPATSLRVSLADKTYNARAIVDDLRVHGDALWSRFTGGRDGSLWYYEELASVFARVAPGPAADRFARIVAEMHTLGRIVPPAST